jgi:small subunit ribosomal protein S13
MAEKQESSNFKYIVRIANVDVPGGKAIRVALTKIKGIGTNFADAVCAVAKVDGSIRAGDLPTTDVEKLNKTVNNPVEAGIPIWMFNRKKDYESGEDKHLHTGTLGFIQENDIKRLKKTKTLRGMRHQRKLPLRGQRTRSNFRRSKGKVVGVKKKGVKNK